MYNVPQEVGVNLYGIKYRSATYMVRKHLYGGASKECDHWHDDAGIVTHHMAFTLEAEQSLQAIDPQLAMPYWDYTYDAYYYNVSGTCGMSCIGSDWADAEIYDLDFFGPIANKTTSYVVTEGIWAYTRVLTDAWEYSDIVNFFFFS